MQGDQRPAVVGVAVSVAGRSDLDPTAIHWVEFREARDYVVGEDRLLLFAFADADNGGVPFATFPRAEWRAVRLMFEEGPADGE